MNFYRPINDERDIAHSTKHRHSKLWYSNKDKYKLVAQKTRDIMFNPKSYKSSIKKKIHKIK